MAQSSPPHFGHPPIDDRRVIPAGKATLTYPSVAVEGVVGGGAEGVPGGCRGGSSTQPTIQSSSISFDTNDRYFFATSFATFSRNHKGILLLLLMTRLGHKHH